MKRRLKTVFIKLVKLILYAIPWSPYNKLSKRDYNSFKEVYDTWKGKDEEPCYLLRWTITQWCNYKCVYCPQIHDRYAKYGEYTAHAFDNYPAAKWIENFRKHFHNKRLSITISGGEPLLDWKNMSYLLTELSGMSNVVSIRIDTNASWSVQKYMNLDKSKIILMCTYHPSQISKEKYLNNLDSILKAGFKIGIVNYVMTKENLEAYDLVKLDFDIRGLILHPNPLWDSKGNYSKEEYDFLRLRLPYFDFKYKAQTTTTFGKKCLFPSVAYEMDHTGFIHVGCYNDRKFHFINSESLDTFIGPVYCPYNSCTCLDKYSFLKESKRNTSLDPLRSYTDQLSKGPNGEQLIKF